MGSQLFISRRDFIAVYPIKHAIFRKQFFFLNFFKVLKISTALKYATSVGRRMITINQFENWREIIFAAAISCQLQHQREATSSFAEVDMPTFNVGLFVIQSKDFLTLRSFCY